MRLSFHTLDVFTQTRFGGNPLAVVLDADALTGAQMQTITREFNLSETVFLLKPENSMHTARARIFTPAAEVPFAGHPTVGMAALLAQMRAPDPNGSHDAIIVLEQPIGTVRVGVRLRAGQAAFAEFDAPKLPVEGGSLAAIEDIAAAVGLIPSEIGFENHKPTVFSAGLAFTFIPVRSLEAIARARPVLSRWDRGIDAKTAAFLYCRQTRHVTSQFHARMFGPNFGVTEDPATGSAAAALSAIIHRFDTLSAGDYRFVIEQGFEMARPSLIHLSIEVGNGKLSAVRIGGSSVPVSSGTLLV